MLFNIVVLYTIFSNDIWATFLTENSEILSNTKAELKNSFAYI